MNSKVAALLATDTEADLLNGLGNRLGYDADITVSDHDIPWTVWDDDEVIGEGISKAEAIAAAIVYLDSKVAPELEDDGSAIEHERWLRSDK